MGLRCRIAVSLPLVRTPERKNEMTTFQAALVKEQGATFVVVSVRDSVIDNRSEANEMIRAMSLRFGCPAVLVGAQHHRILGHRRDIVDFVASVGLRRLPWRQWTVAA